MAVERSKRINLYDEEKLKQVNPENMKLLENIRLICQFVTYHQTPCMAIMSI